MASVLGMYTPPLNNGHCSKMVLQVQVAMEVCGPWDIQTARHIPNNWDLVLVLVLGQLAKQYTDFACHQTFCSLQWGGRVVSIYRKVVLFVLRFVNKWS